MGEDELEQLDLYQEEIDQLLQDKKFEEEQLLKNAEEVKQLDSQLK